MKGSIYTGVVVFVLSVGLVWGGESGTGVGLGGDPEIDLTPQNDRIAIFCDGLIGDLYATHLGMIVGRPVDVRPYPTHSGDAGTVGSALPLSSWFSETGNEYGIIITDYGAWDRVFGDDAHGKMEVTPWETTEANLRELFRRLKATGAIVVYNQAVPESEAPFGAICEEEGVIRVPDWKEDMAVIPGPGNYFHHFCWWNGVYQSPLPESECEFIRYWKNLVLAERTAKVMRDVGIVDWTEPCDLESLDFEGLYSNASQLLDELVDLDLATEEVDLDIEPMEWWLDQAEPLYEVGACFTTRCLLRAGIEPLRTTVEHWDDIQELFRLWEQDFDHEPTDWKVYPHLWFREQGDLTDSERFRKTMLSRLAFSLEHWDEVVEMFDNASTLLDAAKEQGIGTSYQDACYVIAKKSWRDLDYDAVVDSLGRIQSDLEPLLAEESEEDYVTVYYEDFDTDNPQAKWHLSQTGWESAGVCDGCAYLNLSAESTDDSTCLSGVFGTLDAVTGRTGNWLYVSMDVRMRFSDDNKLNSDFGGGLRYWGLDEQFSSPPNFIHFGSWSPEAGPRAGFDVEVDINDSSVFSADLSGVDMRDWHVYTILWEPDGVEFLVDGESVGSSDQSPSVPMSPHVHIWNILDTKGSPYLPMVDLEHDVWAQIDYLRCYVPRERFDAWSQEVSDLMSGADGVVGALVEAGFDCGEEEETLYLVQGNWVEGNYNYVAVKEHVDEVTAPLSGFLDLLSGRSDEVEEMFSQARFCVETLKSEGDDRMATISTADLLRAEKAWWSDLDYEATCTALNNIMARCSEPVLSLLSLLVMPLLLHRIGRKSHWA